VKVLQIDIDHEPPQPAYVRGWRVRLHCRTPLPVRPPCVPRGPLEVLNLHKPFGSRVTFVTPESALAMRNHGLKQLVARRIIAVDAAVVAGQHLSLLPIGPGTQLRVSAPRCYHLQTSNPGLASGQAASTRCARRTQARATEGQHGETKTPLVPAVDEQRRLPQATRAPRLSWTPPARSGRVGACVSGQAYHRHPTRDEPMAWKRVVAMNTYTAVASRDGRYWRVRIPGLGNRPEYGLPTHARTFADVEPMARDCIALWLRVPAQSFRLHVRTERRPRFSG
jgi:hypothetical protein